MASSSTTSTTSSRRSGSTSTTSSRRSGCTSSRRRTRGCRWAEQITVFEHLDPTAETPQGLGDGTTYSTNTLVERHLTTVGGLDVVCDDGVHVATPAAPFRGEAAQKLLKLEAAEKKKKKAASTAEKRKGQERKQAADRQARGGSGLVQEPAQPVCSARVVSAAQQERAQAERVAQQARRRAMQTVTVSVTNDAEEAGIMYVDTEQGVAVLAVCPKGSAVMLGKISIGMLLVAVGGSKVSAVSEVRSFLAGSSSPVELEFQRQFYRPKPGCCRRAYVRGTQTQLIPVQIQWLETHVWKPNAAKTEPGSDAEKATRMQEDFKNVLHPVSQTALCLTATQINSWIGKTVQSRKAAALKGAATAAATAMLEQAATAATEAKEQDAASQPTATALAVDQVAAMDQSA